MTSEEIAIVQASFAKVAPIADAAAELFYGRLFELAPEAQALFKGDMREQGRKLMAALSIIVNGLTKLDEIAPLAQALAIRHAGYGVKPEHYAVAGEALIWTLERGLGDSFTPETKAAWLSAYATLSDVMLAAAYPKP
jgi:nitric oxide dioxygenase